MAEMTGFAERLLSITDGCRADMHEPDEQNVVAEVGGRKLDNVYGDTWNTDEYVVTLRRDIGLDAYALERFNLATLIALARIGARAAALGREWDAS